MRARCARVCATRRSRTSAGERAVDHDRLEIDHRQQRGDRLRQRLGGLGDPDVERLGEVRPVVRRKPDVGAAPAGGDQPTLQPIDRRGADQLLQAGITIRLATHDRHRPERAGIAAATGKQAAVEDDAAADEGPDVEIGEVAIGCAGAEGELGGASRRRVVAEANRPRAKRRVSSSATSKSRHCPSAPGGVSRSASQFQSSNGIATPRPLMRLCCATGSSASRFGISRSAKARIS